MYNTFAYNQISYQSLLISSPTIIYTTLPAYIDQNSLTSAIGQNDTAISIDQNNGTIYLG